MLAVSTQPLYDYRTVIELIGATKTKEGLEVRCELDTNIYEKGRKVTDEEMELINLHPHKFHGEWNYTIKPREYCNSVYLYSYLCIDPYVPFGEMMDVLNTAPAKLPRI